MVMVAIVVVARLLDRWLAGIVKAQRHTMGVLAIAWDQSSTSS